MCINIGKHGAAAVAALLLVAACGHTTVPVLRSPAELAAEENRLLHSGPTDAPLPMVTNESAAGRAILAAPCRPVLPEDPGLSLLISRMLASVKQEGGVGIAAPQVGVNRQVIIVQRQDEDGEPFRAYINPEILAYSDDKVVDYEGCLSIPGWFGQVSRSASITISYFTPEGDAHVDDVAGWTARIFQHEVDHINGVLFVEIREPGELISEEEYRRIKEERKQKRLQEADD